MAWTKEQIAAWRQIEWAAQERAGWMQRLRTVAAKYGASFDDIREQDIEKLAVLVGAPIDEIKPGLSYAKLELYVTRWAMAQRASAKPPAAADPAKNGRSENLQPCWIQAHDAYQRAVANESCGETLKAVHDWLHENDPDDYNLPSFGTWAKYVRAYRNATGGTVNHSRRGRTGRSVVDQSDI